MNTGRSSMLWQQCLNQLEHELPHSEINTWLRSLHALEQSDSMCLLAPNPIVLQQIHSEYLPRILFHARTLSGIKEYDVILQIGSRPIAQPKPVQDSVNNINVNDAADHVSNGSMHATPISLSLIHI